ncbi:hypothetical protein swp_4281 [Shewanella piezotolerans WP3]|uniref:Uncharacterized protein n=1 Tax=Shewanella piezotolerans (strain WP3 / JCM 13877) TaxID=225849 RepID=B8CU77_SHEPW|nr:hypothetical protein swp_4281 [Shewanella piezotolerans WP3]
MHMQQHYSVAINSMTHRIKQALKPVMICQAVGEI